MMDTDLPDPPKVFGNQQCTVDSRRALRTVSTKLIGPSSVAAVCICRHTAVSYSFDSCLRLLNRKHRKL